MAGAGEHPRAELAEQRDGGGAGAFGSGGDENAFAAEGQKVSHYLISRRAMRASAS